MQFKDQDGLFLWLPLGSEEISLRLTPTSVMFLHAYLVTNVTHEYILYRSIVSKGYWGVESEL